VGEVKRDLDQIEIQTESSGVKSHNGMLRPSFWKIYDTSTGEQLKAVTRLVIEVTSSPSIRVLEMEEYEYDADGKLVAEWDEERRRQKAKTITTRRYNCAGFGDHRAFCGEGRHHHHDETCETLTARLDSLAAGLKLEAEEAEALALHSAHAKELIAIAKSVRSTAKSLETMKR
jgi:hypothetical protein